MLRPFTKQNLNESHTLVAARPTLVPTQVALAITLAAIAAFCCGPAAFGQCQYEVTAILDIGDCDIGSSITRATGLNNNSDVVGYYLPCAIGNERAFFWSQETGFITLPTPPNVFRAWAYNINDNRIIVGQHEIPGIGRMGFVYDMNKNNGEYVYLEPLHDGATGTNTSSANAINNAGVVAGSRAIGKPGTSPMPYNAVIWDTNTGEVIDLGVMEGPNSRALDITQDSHHVVGWDGVSIPTTLGYLWTSDRTINLGPVPQTDSSNAEAINAADVVVGSGFSFSKSYWRAFIWLDGQMTVIPPVSSFTSSRGRAINDIDQVGVLMSASGVFRGYLWQNGEIHSVNSLLVPGSGISVQSTASINNSGQILGSIGTRAVLLTPINVPLGDLNYDCNVDSHDLMILLDAWGPQSVRREGSGTETHPADLNGDGVVDGADLLILLANWNP